MTIKIRLWNLDKRSRLGESFLHVWFTIVGGRLWL